MHLNTDVLKRYATALFNSLDPSKREETLNELRIFQSALRGSPEVTAFFLSPVISRNDKKLVLADLQAKFPSIHPFLELLVEEDRTEVLVGIVEAFSELKELASGELSVELECAETFSEEMVNEIRSMLQEKWNKKLKIKTKQNSELIGGFVARAPGRLYDASLATQLQSLKEQVLSQ
jgi:F-type H+-transporting ATPase subunit delta